MTTLRTLPPHDLADELALRLSGGTRFMLFPVYGEGMAPEVVTVPLPAGSIGPGPSDPALYVADAADKPAPYHPPLYAPPYEGALLAPATPNAEGHFDHIPFGTPQFLAAHLYGSVRHTLEIWQHYLRQPIPWESEAEHPRMELVPLLHWNNAQSGPGFLETGLWHGPQGMTQPFALNFDVAAHETGHQILFSKMGVPDEDQIGVPFLAFHEAFADLVAIIGLMHFPSVLPNLLAETEGNLYVLNCVNRFAETSPHTQIRLASNTLTMADVAGIRLAPDGTWIDPLGLRRNQHAVAQPLEGAIFDVFVEIYQETLVSEGLIPEDADARGWTRAEVEEAFDSLHLQSARAYRQFYPGFAAAIRHARDEVARAMAHVMLTVHPAGLTFDEVAARFIEGLLQQGNGAVLHAAIDHFLWRGIDPRRYLRFIPVGRRGRMFRVAATAHRTVCRSCNPGASQHAARMIRAGHDAAPARQPQFHLGHALFAAPA